MSEIKRWDEVVGLDMPEQSAITEEVRAETLKEASRFRGSVRLVTGHFWTDEEYTRERKKVLNTPLP
ncbi:MAG: hypothetical protein ACLQSR_14645 [Limisphaerales bacterium]